MSTSPDQDFVLKTVRERGIHFIRLWFTDVLGSLKSMAITPSELEDTFAEGMGFDGSSIEGFSDVEESDMIASPDASTFQVLPWRPQDNGVARMFCDIKNPDGSTFEGDPRACLRRMCDRAADMGYTMTVGTEMEYFYFRDSKTPKPLDDGGFFDLTPLDNATDLRRETVLTLEKIGVSVEYSHHESSPSQHEIDLRFSDALNMADSVMTYRLVAKEIAAKHGVYASFMPKPIMDSNGSGMHVHQSLFDEAGNDVFFDDADESGNGLSKIAKHYIAGILAYAPEFFLITNQYVNSYKRLVPGFDAPMYVSWAQRNRSSMVRIPRYKPGKESACRIELRNPDPATNPYLAFAVMLGAGLKGITDELEIPLPVDGENLFSYSEDELAAAGIKRLPSNLGQAIERFESSELMRDILGEHIFDFLVRNKKREWQEYSTYVSPWETRRFLPKL